MAKHVVIFAGLSLLAAIPCSADIIYVKDGGTGSGTSWLDPNGILQIAINNASNNDEVWVAAGIFKPTMEVGGSGERYKTFQMKNGVKIYGSFPDTGNPDMADRDPNMYKTILSGDLLGNDNPDTLVEDLFDDPCRADNCYHVFYHPSGTNLNTSAILDGFTITEGNAGNASAPEDHKVGGGMYNYASNPTVTGCTFTSNSAVIGGGMWNYSSDPKVTGCTFGGNFAGDGGGMNNNSNSNPTLTNCTFGGNWAYWGGGMGNSDNSSPTVINCTFTGNYANDQGGGMRNFDYTSRPTVISCTFTDNSAGQSGGGMYNDEASPTVTGCTFSGNSAPNGGGMWSYRYCFLEVTNCTFAGNSADAGGGMFTYIADLRLKNCTFAGNWANDEGGGMWNYTSYLKVTNCILWDNSATNSNEIYNDPTFYIAPVISYCDIAGSGGSSSWDPNLGTDAGGNIDADPLFADPNGPDGIIGTEDDNLRLLAGSPCIDTGNNAAVPADTLDLDGDGNTTEPIPFDIDGLPRLYDDLHTIDTGSGTPPIVDMGAHEFIPCDFEPDGDIDEVDFITLILYWLDTGCGRCGGADLTGEGDVDLADFAEFVTLWQAGV